MQLLYTLTAYPPAIGGAQLHQHLIAQHLKNRHQIQVVSHWNQNRTDWLRGTTINAPNQPFDYTIDQIPVHRLGLDSTEKLRLLPYLPIYYPLMGLALPPITKAIAEQLNPYAQNADLVHNVRIGREGLSYASHQIAKKYDIPFVFTPVHHPRWIGWRYRAYIELYKKADAIVALTQTEKQILIGLGVRPELITVTGMGPVLAETANPQDFYNRYQIQEPIILFLAQHYPYKGYQQLLASAPLVWQKYPKAQFVFVGPAVANSEKYFKNIDSRIHRLGALKLQDKTNALAACTILCVPSSQESFGGVYTEAWHFAKPVIGCNIPAVAEVIDQGINGYLVSQTPESIAEAIFKLLKNHHRAQAMGQAGQKKLQNQYTWEAIAHKTQALYCQLMK
ncbi:MULTISPECIES: glycosyltransferase family 4 protein [unclassified Synechocystis]|uniref:glycosyltransferase family 4 protein n=1 Tax=unclassified Synechocystis TaxID=2640012 RepID=UPI0004094F17|nr:MULTISPECIES: glycosyltransferase family 4 protein [unclassified Synechocystis]AIE74135.1 glycosyl transferase, group 1 [Synechocystis sp. PCC 6714]MCT0252774.1 glycosyltransferase family 4 protein [Synechocystis sp. CS-94]